MGDNRRGIIWFFIIAFGGAWAVWSIPLILGIPAQSALFQVYVLPGAFAPALACFIVRKWITREGFADAGLRLDLTKWRYYLFGLLLPYAVIAVICVEADAFGLTLPDFSNLSVLNLLMVGGLAVITTPLLWGEEFGWRAYLQQRWFARNPLIAAIATGLVWAIWHYPVVAVGYDYQDEYWLGMAVMPVMTILISIVFGWLRQAAGSIWASSFAHAATNAVGGGLTTMLFQNAGHPTIYGYGGTLAWIPLGIVAAWIVLTGRLRST